MSSLQVGLEVALLGENRLAKRAVVTEILVRAFHVVSETSSTLVALATPYMITSVPSAFVNV